MRKLLLIIVIALFSDKIKAQCSVPVQSLTETFTGTVLPTCWGYGGNPGTIVSNAVSLSSGSSINALLCLPKTNNARGIITFDAKRNTGTSVASPVQVGVVSASGNQASFVLLQTVNTNYTMTNYTVNLAAYTGTFQFVTLRSQGPSMVSGDNAGFTIDNVTYISGCESASVTAIAQNYTVQLNSLGTATLGANQINNGSTSGCGSPTVTISKTNFNCSNVGVNTITLTALDNMGNISTATASVTVLSAINNETLSVSQSTICTGKSATVTTGSSVNGIKYYLRDDATNTIVTGPITGTGGALAFNTGSLTTNTTFNVYAETPASSALDFDGVNDRITTTLTTTASNSLTIEAWIYPRATTHKRIVSNYFNNAAQSGEIILDTYNPTNNGRGLRLVVEGAGNTLHTLTVANTLTLNAWNHVAGTFANGVTKLYVNGIAVATSTAPFTSIPSCTNTITIGEDPTVGAAEYFNGKMDEVRIWNTERTQTEIAGNKNNCLVGNEAGLKTYFKIFENVGSITTDAVLGSVGTMSGMDPNTVWTLGNVDCGTSVCSHEMTNLITVNVVANPTIAVNSGSICSGTSFTITPSGASSYTFQGGNAMVSPTSTTSYTVIGASTFGCLSSTVTSSVSVNPSPTLTVNSGSICVGQSFSMTPSGASTYTFSSGSSVVSPTASSVYTVTGTNSGCVGSTTSNVTVNLCTGIEAASQVNMYEVVVYPNPTNGAFTLATQNDCELQIIDVLGKVVMKQHLNKGQHSIDLSNETNGMYFIKITANGSSKTGKIVKQ